MLEDMFNLKYFLNHPCVHDPLSHVRLSFTFNTIIESMNVGDHFDMHFGY